MGDVVCVGVSGVIFGGVELGFFGGCGDSCCGGGFWCRGGFSFGRFVVFGLLFGFVFVVGGVVFGGVFFCCCWRRVVFFIFGFGERRRGGMEFFFYCLM